MALLENHLDQISASAKSIGDLQFPAPRAFTNALLNEHEITTLIRDTEPHERSLFTVNSNLSDVPESTVARRFVGGVDGPNRRKTVTQTTQRPGSAVAKVLGSDMLRQIQRSSSGTGRSHGVDIEVLLHAAERLCAVYPADGAKDRIKKLRNRHSETVRSVSHYDGLVARQQAKLSRMNINEGVQDQSDDEDAETQDIVPVQSMTEDDIRAEEEEIRELESKKKALEARISGMERDLGGLLR